MNKRVLVFDTETTSLNKPFCYNVGWVVAQMEDDGSFTVLDEREYMVKQVWYNSMLFATAFYADKKQIYHERIRQGFIKVVRFDELINILSETINFYNVEIAYAYNSPFDVRVFQFCTEWFHTPNPLAEIPVYDIRAYFMDTVKNNDEYKLFCENNELFTETGNYSTSAETAYKYIIND